MSGMNTLKTNYTIKICFKIDLAFGNDLVLRSGVLRTQKLKTHLLRTQSSKVCPLKPGAGQYIKSGVCFTYC